MITDNPNFTWWIGVVEWNVDPALLGRVKVRIFGYHSAAYLNEIKTQSLPWAACLNAPNVHGAYGRPNVGDWVLGFFLDGSDAQEPMVLGVIPGNIESNMGQASAKWSSESEISFPSVYQNPTNSADSNRDAYIQEIYGKVKFKLDPDGGLSGKPKISLTMPQDNTGVEIYSDNISPIKPVNPSTYLNIANGSNASVVIKNEYETSKTSITLQADDIILKDKTGVVTVSEIKALIDQLAQ